MATATSAKRALGGSELQAVASLFQEIKRGVKGREDEELTRVFERHVLGVMGLLEERLRSLGEGEALGREAEIALAKHGCYDVCFQTLIDMVPTECTGPLRTLCAAHARLFRGFAERVCEVERERLAEMDALRTAKQRAQAESEELLEAARVMDEEADARHATTVELRRRLNALEKEPRQKGKESRKVSKPWTRKQ